MMDFDNTFNESLRNLGNNKLPGPDGLINELLQVLPDDLKHALHDLFVTMWISEETPSCLKNSNNNNNKRPLTPKSMPPAGDEHAKLKT